VSRPWARTADGEREVELASYAHCAVRDRLSDAGALACQSATICV
jgi:hypothetical protein